MRRGISLLELLVAITVAAFLATLAYVAMGSARSRAHRYVSECRIVQLSAKLEEWKQLHGGYPAGLNQIEADVPRNADGEYTDAWGTPFVYIPRPNPKPPVSVGTDRLRTTVPITVNGRTVWYSAMMEPVLTGNGSTDYAATQRYMLNLLYEGLWKESELRTVPFAILSAGRDRQMGGGTIGALIPFLDGGIRGWTPGEGVWAQGQPGYDDVANFHTGILGVR